MSDENFIIIQILIMVAMLILAISRFDQKLVLTKIQTDIIKNYFEKCECGNGAIFWITDKEKEFESCLSICAGI